MSQLLEKLAARAAAKHWDVLSRETKNRLLDLDPESASAKWRKDVGKFIGRQKADIKSSGVRLSEAEAPLGVLGRSHYEFDRKDKPDELTIYSPSKATSRRFASDIYSKSLTKNHEWKYDEKSADKDALIDVLSVLGKRTGAGRDGFIPHVREFKKPNPSGKGRKMSLEDRKRFIESHKPVGLLDLKKNDPYAYSVVSDKIRKDSQDNFVKISKKRRYDMKNISELRNLEKGFQALPRAHEADEGAEETAKSELMKKMFLPQKYRNNPIGTHASSRILTNESELVRRAPKKLKQFWIDMRKDGNQSPILDSAHVLNQTDSEKAMRKKLQELFSGDSVPIGMGRSSGPMRGLLGAGGSQASLFHGKYGTQKLRDKDKRRITQKVDAIDDVTAHPVRLKESTFVKFLEEKRH